MNRNECICQYGLAFFDHCVGGPIILVPYHLCVKKRGSSVFLNLHCKSNGWSYVVEVGQESIQFISSVLPEEKCVIYVSQP